MDYTHSCLRTCINNLLASGLNATRVLNLAFLLSIHPVVASHSFLVSFSQFLGFSMYEVDDSLVIRVFDSQLKGPGFKPQRWPSTCRRSCTRMLLNLFSNVFKIFLTRLLS